MEATISVEYAGNLQYSKSRRSASLNGLQVKASLGAPPNLWTKIQKFGGSRRREPELAGNERW